MNFLFESTIRISIVLIVALLSTAALRKKSASLRHGILSAAILTAALIPAASAFGPSWQTPSAAVPEALVLPTIDTSAAKSPVSTQGFAPVLESNGKIQKVPYIVWIGGVVMSLLVIVVGAIRLRLLSVASQPMAQQRWTVLSSAIAREYRLRWPPRLLQSPNPSILMTWGILRPKVVLPAGAENWNEERASIVLSHELAHIRRLDWLIHTTAEVLRALHWFNPLMWVVCRRLRIESEYACDDAAISRGIAGSNYAGHLLDLARALNTPEQAWSAAIAMARPSTIERRFAAMLNPSLNRSPLSLRALIAIAIASACLSLPLAIFGGSEAVQVVTAGLTGSVSDSSGAAVPSATVIVSTPDGRTEVTTTTNANGRFGFTNMPAGMHVIQVFAQGFGASRITNVDLKAGQQTVQDVRMDIGFMAVERAQPAASRPKADPNPQPVPQSQQRSNSVVTGQGTIQGIVTDPTGAVVPNVDMKLSFPGGFTRTVITDERGVFTFSRIPDETYRVSAGLPGFKTINIDNIVISGGNVSELKITLSVASMAEEMTVRSDNGDCAATPVITSPLVVGTTGGKRGPEAPQYTFSKLSQTNMPTRIRQGGSVQMAMIVKLVKPAYPCDAKAAGIEGAVIMEAVVGKDGKVIERKVISGNEILAAAVTAALDQWQYTPTLLNGEPVEVVTTITANFVLMK